MQRTQTVVFIKGNVRYAEVKGQLEELNRFYKEVVDLIEDYSTTVKVVESDVMSSQIPKANKYVGHSRGCGYLFLSGTNDTYFCLDRYEDVPKGYFDGDMNATKLEDRPPIHPGHMELNPTMKKELIKFLKR